MTLNWQLLQQFIIKHELSKRPLVVALSGGIDSVCLLQLFIEIRQQTGQDFVAVHVNHGLSEHAVDWQHQVESLCLENQVKLTSCVISLTKASRTSLEQLARDGRYQAIAEAVPAKAVVFTGHHQADQFETFILRLMRGSGLTGLASMRELSSYPNEFGQSKNLQLARPLLSINKHQITDLVKQVAGSWVEDESNLDTGFDRNFVRHNLLPNFESKWPQALSSVQNTTSLLQQELDLLNEYIAVDLKQVLTTGFEQQQVMDLAKLKMLSINKQGPIVRHYIQKHTGEYPSRNALEQFFLQMNESKVDRQPEIKVGEFSLRIYKSLLYITKRIASNIPLTSSKVKTNMWVELPNDSNYATMFIETFDEADCSLKWGALSDKLQPHPNSGSKQVKAVLKELNCPPWLRSSIPLIYVHGTLVAIADKVIDYRWKKQLKITLKKA